MQPMKMLTSIRRVTQISLRDKTGEITGKLKNANKKMISKKRIVRFIDVFILVNMKSRGTGFTEVITDVSGEKYYYLFNAQW
jgi:hypothetical protein